MKVIEPKQPEKVAISAQLPRFLTRLHNVSGIMTLALKDLETKAELVVNGIEITVSEQAPWATQSEGGEEHTCRRLTFHTFLAYPSALAEGLEERARDDVWAGADGSLYAALIQKARAMGYYCEENMTSDADGGYVWNWGDGLNLAKSIAFPLFCEDPEKEAEEACAMMANTVREMMSIREEFKAVRTN